MKKNRWVTDQDRKKFKLDTGKDYPETRCSGRTTGLKFYFVGKAITHPGQVILIRDHSENANSDKMLSKAIEKLIEAFKLEFLRVFKDDHGDMNIVYEIFEG